MRSGITKHCDELDLPIAAGSSGNGRFSRMRKRRSSITSMVSVTRRSACPNPSRADQRAMEAMQSCERTGTPPWNVSPSRRPMTTLRPLSSTVQPSAICGRGT